MGRQAVHEDRIRVGISHQLAIHSKICENGRSIFCFCFLAHAGPDIGINNAGASNRFHRIIDNLNLGPGVSGSFFGLADNPMIGFEPFGRGDP